MQTSTRANRAGVWTRLSASISNYSRLCVLWCEAPHTFLILKCSVPERRDAILLRKQGHAPKVLVTDRLASYGRARRELGMRALRL
jgi:hypothetical protein